ncbi:MAG TPA: hypothetical protein VK939_11790 [Longimicrobiales bacterium]|nr:hypothetical protein [Longimicrobiales bacterium]
MLWIILGAAVALGGGIYVGLGAPGMPGREDRVLPPGSRPRRLERRRIDWLRPPRR